MSPTMAYVSAAVTIAVGVLNFLLVIGMTRQAARTQRVLVALSRFVVDHTTGVVPREVEDFLATTYGGGNHRGR
jgi:hypothetical protein